MPSRTGLRSDGRQVRRWRALLARRATVPLTVFVVTHETREPWERLGGTTFHFVNGGMKAAIEQARAAAGERDVRVSGGGETIVQCLNAGLIEEFTVALAPVLFGKGIRLFEGVDASRVAVEQVSSESSLPLATHLTYAVHGRSSRG
ncbi:dihydrofolate reductase family protein [Gordonia sp. HY002]|uniref:dihydrofolate reductase family protein n=1 Tax=Gordonia zhenghanii TaxID=2911516 RepID=UPI001EEFC83D|nr:dihydrofolate reductase family protein [Gordonia zhenghanii]MCF8570078.1 dihydrofolate reductase family protein [Gordonia zhenghanii]MCF8605191.1 dihydrofolate reductase family protein [Gordonia zhenghanii]